MGTLTQAEQGPSALKPPSGAAGAAQANAALLLVDGSPGGFEAGLDGAGNGHAGGGGGGGQTREHAQLARSLGVEQLAVVVSKLDTSDYSQVRVQGLGRGSHGTRSGWGWLVGKPGRGAVGGCGVQAGHHYSQVRAQD